MKKMSLKIFVTGMFFIASVLGAGVILPGLYINVPASGLPIDIKMNETYEFKRDSFKTGELINQGYSVNETTNDTTGVRTLVVSKDNLTIQIKEITLFVAPDGDNNNDGISINTPLENLANTLTLVSNNFSNIDIVNIKVKGGTYYHQNKPFEFTKTTIGQINLIGCNDSDGNKPVFDGRNNSQETEGSLSSWLNILGTQEANGSSYGVFNIKNFKVKYYNTGLALRQIKNSIFESIDFEYIGDRYTYIVSNNSPYVRAVAYAAITMNSNTSNNIVANCSFDYINNFQENDRLIHALYISDGSSGNKIYNNVFKSIEPNGPVKVRNGSSDNLVYNNKSIGTGYRVGYMYDGYYTREHPKHADDETDELPSVGNKFYNNYLYGGWYGDPIDTIVRYKNDKLLNYDPAYLEEKNNTTISISKVELVDAKREYFVGNSIQIGDVKIRVTYQDGSVYEFYEGFKIEPDKFTEAGEKVVSIYYPPNKNKLSYNVTVSPTNNGRIEITTLPNKVNYTQNREKLNLRGGEIVVVYDSANSETVSMTNANIRTSGFDNTKLGKDTITLEYNGLSTTFDVTIVEKLTSKIELTNLPTKLTYIQDETLDLTGGIVKITYNNSSTENIDLMNSKVKVYGFDSSEVGKNTVTVEYDGKKTTFDVTIVEKSGADEQDGGPGDSNQPNDNEQQGGNSDDNRQLNNENEDSNNYEGGNRDNEEIATSYNEMSSPSSDASVYRERSVAAANSGLVSKSYFSIWIRGLIGIAACMMMLVGILRLFKSNVG